MAIALTDWVDRNRVINLSHPYRRDMPDIPPHGQPAFTSAIHKINGEPFTIGKLAMSTHTGTHIDFPSHLLPGGKTQDDFLPEYFLGSAVVLDVKREGISPITVDDLRDGGPEIIDGEIVLLYFGYGEKFGSNEYRQAHPYLTTEACEYLVSKKVRILGLDLQTPDLPASQRGENFDFPAHRTLLGQDCLILENLNAQLALLARQRIAFSALPLELPGADGSPVRAVASLV